MASKTKRVYYWEHGKDPSRYLRSTRARDMARVAHAAGGGTGVILYDGGPLRVVPVLIGRTVSETTRRLVAAR